MQITEIAFSVYPVTNIVKSKDFYEKILGLEVTSETDMGGQGHWVEYDIGAGTLAIAQYEGWNPVSDGCSVGLEVLNFDEAVKTIEDSKTPISMGPIESPVCHMIMILDPDNNKIVIHKRKPGHH